MASNGTTAIMDSTTCHKEPSVVARPATTTATIRAPSPSTRPTWTVPASPRRQTMREGTPPAAPYVNGVGAVAGHPLTCPPPMTTDYSKRVGAHLAAAGPELENVAVRRHDDALQAVPSAV